MAPALRALVASDISAVNPSALTGSGTVPSAALPVATAGALGAIKVGSNLSISSGVLSGQPGTVTSIDLAVQPEFTLAGNPITGAGTITIGKATQAAGAVWAGPTSGGAAAPTFRSLVASDIPALSYVTSVAFSAPAEFTVAGSPVTSSGTITLTKAVQAANTIYAGPVSGSAAAPTFRTAVANDAPDLLALAWMEVA